MTPPSIALCANVYQDASALRGLLEFGSRYFDNIFIIHTGPGGVLSTDGTVELAESFGATVKFDDIQKGFGVIRTRLIHECGCEWAMIMDADERFFPHINMMDCSGTEEYPGVAEPRLSVTVRPELIDQGTRLRSLITRPDINAVRSTRRHWFDFTMRKPTQNWMINRDHQLRIVRNRGEIGYERGRVMHERLIDSRTGNTPTFAEQDDYGGIFYDHFHMHFRRTQPGKKEANEQNYGRLERGEAMTV